MKKVKSVGAIILDGNKFLIVKKTKQGGGHWDFPKGAVKRDESDEIKTLHREIKEETNLDIEIIPEFYEELHYTYSDQYGDFDKVVGYYLCKPLTLDAKSNDLDEIEEVRWVEKKELMELIKFEGVHKIFLKALYFLEKFGYN